jgi:hypothetical protein
MNAQLTDAQVVGVIVERMRRQVIADTLRFYDRLRTYEFDAHSEQGARVQAEFYLRRKIPGLDANDAAVMLADALALRAAARVNP